MEPPIQFNRQDFSHNVLFAMPNRISKEIYRQSMAGFSPIPMELYQKSEALIQPILFNLELKKHGLKVQGSHSQHKHRTAFMVLLPQYNPLDFSCKCSSVTCNESKRIL